MNALKFPTSYEGIVTKDDILDEYNPSQGDNREAKSSESLLSFSYDISNDNNIGSVIFLVKKGKKFFVGDGGNRLLSKLIPGKTLFHLIILTVKTEADLLFVINRLNKVRAHSKGYQAYTNEIIRELVTPWINQFGLAGISIAKENGNRITRSVTYLHAARLILATQTQKADDCNDLPVMPSKAHMKSFVDHMKVFTSASDFLDVRVQRLFRGYPALKGWAAVMKITPKSFTAQDLLPFLSINGGQIDMIAQSLAPRLQYIFWQYVAKIAIGYPCLKREVELLGTKVNTDNLTWIKKEVK